MHIIKKEEETNENENSTVAVLKMIKELKEKLNMPITFKMLTKQFGLRFDSKEIMDELNTLIENGEIKNVAGSEQCYDLY